MEFVALSNKPRVTGSTGDAGRRRGSGKGSDVEAREQVVGGTVAGEGNPSGQPVGLARSFDGAHETEHLPQRMFWIHLAAMGLQSGLTQVGATPVGDHCCDVTRVDGKTATHGLLVYALGQRHPQLAGLLHGSEPRLRVWVIHSTRLTCHGSPRSGRYDDTPASSVAYMVTRCAWMWSG